MVAMTLAVGFVVAFVTLSTAVGRVRNGAKMSNGRIAWKGFIHAGDFTSSAIYAANRDGSRSVQLTHPGDGIVDDLPDWSPDGSTIVFERLFQPAAPDLPTVADEVMRVNRDGSGLTQIGTCLGDCVSNDDPQYSPDGSQIVYTRLMHVSGGSLALGVWIMGSDGSNPHQIEQGQTSTGSEDHEPAWSPDGTSIVFTRVNDTVDPVNGQALFVVATSGGEPRQITPWTLNAGGANWSPDGSKILFESYRDCPCRVTSQAYTVAPDGSGLTQLTKAGRNIEPNWSPDGKQIVYGHQPGVGPDHFPDLWEMDASGKNPAPVVQTRLWESEPDWG
jgi:TolB protein